MQTRPSETNLIFLHQSPYHIPLQKKPERFNLRRKNPEVLDDIH